ncbi:MAG: thioredoxin family protein, partial [Planctomycetota bacterium]
MEKLRAVVGVKLPIDAAIRVGGKQTVLLEHAAFKGMQGRSGVAVVDFFHRDARRYGAVVGTFPIASRAPITRQQLQPILDALPESADVRAELPADGPPESAPKRASSGRASPSLDWHADHAKAMDVARQERRMMLIYFCEEGDSPACGEFARETLTDPEVADRLTQYVKVRLPLSATIVRDGEEKVLL